MVSTVSAPAWDTVPWISEPGSGAKLYLLQRKSANSMSRLAKRAKQMKMQRELFNPFEQQNMKSRPAGHPGPAQKMNSRTKAGQGR